MTAGYRMLADAATLDLLPDPVFVIDATGHVRAANRLAVRLVGGDPLGVLAEDVLPLHDEAGNDWWTTDRPLRGDATLRARIPERDLWLRRPHTDRPVTLTVARHLDEHGEVVLVLSLRRAERRQRLDAARSDLVATVSHELRSPLTAVKGFTKTLLAKWDRFSDDQKRQMLATVNADADRVTRLLGELLDVSRIDAGRLRLRRSMIDLGPVAQRVVERFTTATVAAEGRSVPIDVALPEDGLPAVYADVDKVEQVLTNLVENAVKYGAGRIEVAVTVSPTDVRLTVSDEGVVDPEHLDHLFSKFYRRVGERHTGTGLGLYISRGIVEAHGGRVWAESEPGGGTRFHATLPRGGLELAGVPGVADRAAPSDAPVADDRGRP